MVRHSLSHADPNGALFHWKNGLYRGIPERGVRLCRRLFDEGIVDDLVSKGLVIATEMTDLTADGFPLILKHREVPFVSYPFEWSGEMLRDAALHTIGLLSDLSERGLTLKDAHGWNLLFDGPRPVFVDFGSIIEAGDSPWRVEQEFVDSFLHPLGFVAAGQARIARRLLQDFERGVDADEYALIGGMSVSQLASRVLRIGKSSVRRILPASGLRMLRGHYRDLKRRPAVQAYKAYRFDRLKERLAAMKLPSEATKWSGYYDREFPSFTADNNWTPKHHAVQQLLQRYRPATVLDIGANRGWFSMLAAKKGAKVVAFDTDEVCLNRLHLDTKDACLDVQSLVMSFTQPTPRLGLGEGIAHSAVNRFQCDLVLGLALAHHMVFKAHLNFGQIAAGFAAYVKKVLVVEFVPRDDQHVRQWITDQHDWYTLDNFTQALRRHFRDVNVIASYPDPRVLLVCER
jgi:hypothetical protein